MFNMLRKQHRRHYAPADGGGAEPSRAPVIARLFADRRPVSLSLRR